MPVPSIDVASRGVRHCDRGVDPGAALRWEPGLRPQTAEEAYLTAVLNVVQTKAKGYADTIPACKAPDRGWSRSDGAAREVPRSAYIAGERSAMPTLCHTRLESEAPHGPSLPADSVEVR